MQNEKITPEQIEFISKKYKNIISSENIMSVLENQNIPENILIKFISKIEHTDILKSFLIKFISKIEEFYVFNTFLMEFIRKENNSNTENFYIDRFLTVIKAIQFSSLPDPFFVLYVHAIPKKYKFSVNKVELKHFKDCAFTALMYIINIQNEHERVNQMLDLIKHIYGKKIPDTTDQYDEETTKIIDIMQKEFFKFISKDFKKYNYKQNFIRKILIRENILPDTSSEQYLEQSNQLQVSSVAPLPHGTNSINKLPSDVLKLILEYSSKGRFEIVYPSRSKWGNFLRSALPRVLLPQDNQVHWLKPAEDFYSLVEQEKAALDEKRTKEEHKNKVKTKKLILLSLKKSPKVLPHNDYRQHGNNS